MAKKQVIRKSNRTLNIFAEGGSTNKESPDKKGSILSSLSGVGGSLTGSIGGSLIGGGLQSGAGSAISSIGSTVGGAVGAVNPLLGGIITAGSGIVGGLTNRMFGSKLNQQKISDIQSQNNTLNTTILDSSSNDTVASQWASQGFGDNFTRSDIGKDGWFSNKAKNKYKELQLQQNIARNRMMQSYNNAADNADETQDQLALTNYAALGGYIDVPNIYGYGGPISLYAEGGELDDLNNHGATWSNGVTYINSGGTHEENPNEGVQVGVDSEGNPNLVEEGEVKWNNYIFSNRVFANKKGLKASNLPTSLDNNSFASAAEKLSKQSKEMPNDPISKRSLNVSLSRLQQLQESMRQKQNKTQNNSPNKFAGGGPTEDPFEAPFKMRADGTYPINDTYSLPIQNPTKDSTKRGKLSLSDTAISDMYNDNLVKSATNTKLGFKVPDIVTTTKKPHDPNNFDKGLPFLRYAPAIGSGVAAFTDMMGWTNKPDYSGINKISDTVNHMSPASYRPIGDYMTYKPLDRNYYQNMLDSQAESTKRGIVEQSGGNRATAIAGLLAADYNAQSKVGELARQAEEYNQGLKERVKSFNRGTNQYNSDQALKVDELNMNLDRLKYESSVQQAQMRQEALARANATRSANISNFFNTLGGIGREDTQKNWIRSNPGLLYDISDNGLSYKNKKKG